MDGREERGLDKETREEEEKGEEVGIEKRRKRGRRSR